MKARVIETGEMVNVTPYPTWYQENGQGPDRREWDEDELEFIYSNKKEEESLEADLETFDKKVTEIWGRCAANPNDTIACLHIDSFIEIAHHFYELGLKAQKL